jgi:type VI secretion system protein ImpL
MYWVTILVLLIYLVLVWLLGIWLPVHGSDVWVLRGVLALLGLIGGAVVLWYQYTIKKAREKEAEAEDEAQPSSGDEIDAVVRAAVQRLKHSTLGRGTNLASLPLVFVLGDSGSTKTTILVHSALDPELLAGQVYRETDVIPTASANIWYTRQAIFVDPAGELMGQASRWKRLVKLLQPARFSAAFGKRSQAPRAALVCFDCETFLQAGASETAISAARKLSTRLQEISQSSGISFPVYVLFTKTDRVSFFTEFVREMSKDEVNEVLGTTLPLRSLSAGVYADEETKRLSKAFDDIFYSLAERRITLLPREHESEKLPAIYEFPRELNKLRTLIVQFLVDLGRPSHLGTNPFLRGFYFTGVRPIVVEDVAAARSVAIEAEDTDIGAGATQIFRGGGARLQQAPVAVRSGPRRMPQWVFLTGLFNDVLVKDRVALAASGSSSRVNMLRRVALAIAVAAGVAFLSGFSISFFRNRALENRVQEAVSDLSSLQSPTGQPAVIGDLQKLERLRAELVTLSDYQENGPPLSMRWGLYSGDRLYIDSMPVYFDRFRRLLFGETQNRIADSLSALPDKPVANAPNDAYSKTYDELKAYLITTEPSDHDKSTKEFLTPVLMTHWIAGRDIDQDRKNLAAAQFDFYSVELARQNPYSVVSSRVLVEQARAYLKQFAGIDRSYVQLLSKASQANRDVSFNEQYTDSAGFVLSSHKVKGAFTRSGLLFVQDALKNPSSYTSGEEWVVGKTDAQEMDTVVLRQKLTERYNHDFVSEWNEVLKTSSVAGYASNADADKKLEKLTSPTSPLLEVLYFVSHNVDAAPQDVKAPFGPVQAVEPAGPPDKPPDKYISSTTGDYIKALAGLQAAFHALAQAPGAPDPAQQTAASTASGTAATSVTAIITGIPVDSVFGNQEQVRRLLEEPIKNADTLIKRGPIEAANGGGKGYCSTFGQIAKKFPFASKSTQDATLDDLYSVLGPTGDAWKKLTDAIKPFALPVGTRYDANPTASVRPSQTFLSFASRVSALSATLYPSGSAPPHLSYTLKQLPSNLEGVKVKIGNDTLESDQKTFVWTGAPEDISVTSKGGDPLGSFTGPWSIFKFVAEAHYLGGGKLEWVIQNNDKPIILPNGKQESYDFQLQASGPANPFFDMQGMQCVGQVAGH